jgi:hypothetical protein
LLAIVDWWEQASRDFRGTRKVADEGEIPRHPARSPRSWLARARLPVMTDGVIGVTTQDNGIRAALLHDHDLMALLD